VIAIVGNLSRDRIDGGPPRVGGGPYHAARALRLLGRHALIVAACAAEDRRLLVEPLVRLGLPVAWHESAATAGFTIENAGDGRRMHVDALAGPWPLARLPADVRWVHVAPLTRADFSSEALAALARGRRLLLDAQGLVRPARTGPLELDANYDRNLLQHVSILKLAEEEAALLVAGVDERALRELGVSEVVVTLGSRGCIVYADGFAEHVRAHAVVVRDPTGSGDAFSAVYLAARSGGAAPVAAGRIACSAVAGLLC
jgi:sugar/nucleoside kinase (ribokinase family)